MNDDSLVGGSYSYMSGICVYIFIVAEINYTYQIGILFLQLCSTKVH